MKRLNQNGQSLIEVTIALAIFIVVLIGTVTLGVNAAGLMLSSRLKTQGVALAQEKIELKKGDRSNSCNGLQSGPAQTESGIMVGGISYTRKTTITDNATFPNAALVEVEVSWSEKGSIANNVIVKQIMNKSN